MAQVESLIAQVVQARSQVLQAASGVSTQEGAWKPAPTEWSIAECVEHLVGSRYTADSPSKKWFGEPGPPTSKPRTGRCLVGVGRSVTGLRLSRTLNVSSIGSGSFSPEWTSKP